MTTRFPDPPADDAAIQKSMRDLRLLMADCADGLAEEYYGDAWLDRDDNVDVDQRAAHRRRLEVSLIEIERLLPRVMLGLCQRWGPGPHGEQLDRSLARLRRDINKLNNAETHGVGGAA